MGDYTIVILPGCRFRYMDRDYLYLNEPPIPISDERFISLERKPPSVLNVVPKKHEDLYRVALRDLRQIHGAFDPSITEVVSRIEPKILNLELIKFFPKDIGLMICGYFDEYDRIVKILASKVFYGFCDLLDPFCLQTFRPGNIKGGWFDEQSITYKTDWRYQDLKKHVSLKIYNDDLVVLEDDQNNMNTVSLREVRLSTNMSDAFYLDNDTVIIKIDGLNPGIIVITKKE